MTEIKGHPAWQPILDALPDEFHSVIKPELLKWDQGVQDKITKMNEQYAPYKEFLDNNVDPEVLTNGLGLLMEFQNDPAGIVQQAIEQFDLDYVSQDDHKAAIAQAADASGVDPDLGDDDALMDNPQFKAIMDVVNDLKTKFESKDQTEAERREQEELDKTLAKLAEDKGEFDKTYVLTLMANGVSGEKAVEQWQNTINQATEQRLKEQGVTLSGGQTNETPVVMNGGGDAGSGLSTEPVAVGDLSEKDVNQLVVEMLSQGSD